MTSNAPTFCSSLWLCLEFGSAPCAITSSALYSHSLLCVVQQICAHLAAERGRPGVPFGGIVMIFVGNCLQMPQLKNRLRGLDPAGRLLLLPDVPDYPWAAECLRHPAIRILKVNLRLSRYASVLSNVGFGVLSLR